MLDIACKFCSWIRDLAHEAFKPQASLSVSAGGNNTANRVPSTGIKVPVIASNPAPIPVQKLQADHQLNPTPVNNLPMYIDSRGTPVSLAGAPFASGAQGYIYDIIGHPDKICKIYKPKVPLSRAHLRALSLVGGRKQAGLLVKYLGESFNKSAYFSWPSAPVYLKSDFSTMNANWYEGAAIAGFIMMKVHGETLRSFVDARGAGVSRLGGSSGDRLAWMKIAYNLVLNVAYIHDAGLVVGDMALENFMIRRAMRADGSSYFHIVVIDTDSFSLPGEKCFFRGYTDDYAAPERLKNKDLNPSFESDAFSLGIILFHLLIPGEHPMHRGGVLAGAANLMPFPFTDPNAVINSIVRENWNSLHDSLKRSFEAALSQGPRPTPHDWLLVLRPEIERLAKLPADDPSR